MPAPDPVAKTAAPLEPFLVDAHCHLDLYPNFLEMIQESETHAIRTLAVTTTPLAFQRNQELTAPTQYVRAALGIHPQVIGERAAEISIFEKLLPLTRYVGEVGLDASPRFYSSFQTQERIFQRVLEASAEAGGKILSVHSVRAASRVLKLVEKFFPEDRGTVILHWFTGAQSEAKRAVELGCFFSVNSAMLDRDTGKQLIRIIPPDRVLSETDGPFLLKGKRPVRPLDVCDVICAIATVLNEPTIDVRNRIAQNFRRLLKGNSNRPFEV